MMVRTREFHNIYSDNHWIYSAYKYWFEHIRDPDVPCSTLEFPEWVEKTYNLEWYQFLTGVQITSYSDEDWIRFQLEWL